jgi:AcrR family transcriptional regulator
MDSKVFNLIGSEVHLIWCMARREKNTKMGRPRGFDENAALDAAMRVFWEEGYEGATLADLTAAMRINRSSMFAAFGNKEALFKKAFEHYAETRLAYMHKALEKPTIREVIEYSLRSTVEFLSTPGNPKGCLSVHGALATGPEGDPVKQWLIRGRKHGEAMIRGRFERAKKAGELPRDADPGAYARYLGTLIQGLGVQGASGATKAEMNKMVDLALKFMGY